VWNDPYHWQISSVYLTARQMIRPWQEPGVKEAARRPRIGLNWQLGPPAAGRNTANTLYLCADLDDAERLAPVLGGLVDDLMKQAYARVGKTNDPLDPPLLLVIDEAGNWPMRNLPGRISTCAGLGIQMLLVYLLPSWLLRQVAPARRCWCMARCARRTCTGATGTSTPTCTCWPPANGAPAGPGLPGPQRREAPEDLRPGHQDVAEEDPAASGDSKARRPVGFRVVSVFGERSLVCPPDVPGPPRLLLASWTASRRTGCGRRWPRRSPQPATGCSPTSRPPGPPRRTG